MAMQGLYDVLHLNFVHSISGQQMEQLAGGLVKADAAQRVAKVHDMYLSFATLEAGLFCLNLPDAYRHINEPTASESQIEVCGPVLVFSLPEHSVIELMLLDRLI